jgi:short-subunit dehydrogenase
MIILISGATGTLGTELFHQLLTSRQVTRFILLGRNKDKLLNLQHISISHKIPCNILVIDFSEVNLITYLLNTLDYLPDYLYLFHGYLNQSTSIGMSDISKHLDINYLSVISILEYYLQRTVTLNVAVTSSLASKVPSPTMSAYAASKSALNSYLDSKRCEIPESKLRLLNCILGLVEDTNMTRDIELFKGVRKYDKIEIIRQILLFSVPSCKNGNVSIGNFVKVAQLVNSLSPSMMNVISKWSMPEL